MTSTTEGDLRRALLAVSVLDEIDLHPARDGVVLEGGEPVLLRWDAARAVLGAHAWSSSAARARLGGWLRLHRVASDLGDAAREAVLTAARVLALPAGSALDPGGEWVRQQVPGGALRAGLGVLDLVPDDGGPVPLWPDVAAAVGLDVEVAWAAAAEHRDRMGGLAVARLVRDRRLHRGRPGGAAGAPGSPGLVLRPVGGCDVPTLLSAPVLRDHLAQEDGTGLRTVAVPSRTRGWTDLARIDPAFAGAAWSATEVGRRAFSRPLLVTRDEVCQVPAPPDPAAALAAVLADPAGPDPAPHGAAWG